VSAHAATARPNIVLILADDMGWSDIGCYGGEVPTPHIDALARGGLRFTQFYNNAVCGPSRAALLTGLYCQRVGHKGDHWNQATDFRKCAGIAELLQRAGYFTIMIGKWQERLLPTQHGFDRFYGPMCQGKISYFHEVQLNPFYLNDQRVPLGEDYYLTEALTDNAVRFLKEASARRDQPFFLYLAHVAPHWPLHAREADIAPHRNRYRELGWEHWRAQRYAKQKELGLFEHATPLSAAPMEIPAWKKDDPLRDWHAERMAVYAAQIASLDKSVGRVVEALREAKALDNTLILFFSDNGAALEGGLTPTSSGFGFSPKGKNGEWRRDGVSIVPGSGPKLMPGPAHTFAGYGLAWGNVSNTPWRGMKGMAYEGGIRTPLIAHWPRGLAAPGRITHDVGHVIDLMPTCLELVGADYPLKLGDRTPLPLDGKTLAPLLTNRPRAGHETLYWKVPKHEAVRSGDWMLLRASGQAQWELYDLKRDPAQAHDLAASEPARVGRMAQLWHAWAKETGVE
jgi:arylsulfatase